MSGINTEVIAKLVGQLNFHVDLSGLDRFQRGLEQARQRMLAMSKQADQLSQKLGQTMGIKVDSKAREKLEKQIRTSLDRELRGEVLLQKARRATFNAELAGQKLQFAGQRESAFLTTQGLKDRQQMAVLAAKEQRAEQAKLKTLNLAFKNEDALAQAKARQARIEALHAQQVQRTLNLQAQQQRTLTATQKLEQSMQQARERGQRQAQKFVESQQAAKVRAQRQDVVHQQRQERFQWASSRQAQWEANRNKPEPSTGFLGLGTGALAVGGAAAGVAAVVAAIQALGQRLDQRQAGASESQTYSNIFAQIGGKNPANGKRARDSFAEMTERFGMANNVETASDFRTFMLSQQARGIAMQKSLDTYGTQLAAMRASGMSKTEQQRAVIQLQQVRSIGRADTEDVKTFAEAAPLIKQAIVQAWGQRTGYKGDNLDGAFMKAIPKGSVLSKDFEAGFALFVSQQQEALARQMVSIDAQQQRSDNASYLQQQNINASPELVDAISKRIAAEQELTQSLEPLRQASAELDAAFMGLTARFLRWTMGKDATPQDAAAKVDSLSPDKPAIDPNALTGAIVDSKRTGIEDPIDRIVRRIFGIEDYSKGSASKMEYPEYTFNGAFEMPEVGFPKPPEADGKFNRVLRMPPVLGMKDLASRATRDQTGKSATATPAAVNTTNNTTNVQPANVSLNLTINTPAALDAPESEKVIRKVFEDALRQSYQSLELPQDSE
ncbi:tape measure protein [Pseudomonas caspiana]|uniref:Uncharacterized protein n=1 Tax=Pseudomonas caspiana TaxID=1451454 RepID=A0A1Y3P5B4_9PSED|nr:tape measure protein [Pseudomonas caspiana]OUM73721.1 hypothetical protein AUC60_11640 [Pseudomonas caspiana]